MGLGAAPEARTTKATTDNNVTYPARSTPLEMATLRLNNEKNLSNEKKERHHRHHHHFVTRISIYKIKA